MSGQPPSATDFPVSGGPQVREVRLLGTVQQLAGHILSCGNEMAASHRIEATDVSRAWRRIRGTP